MANPEHVAVVREGADAIRAWRKEHPDTRLELVEADLSRIDLCEADLQRANLFRADLSGAKLGKANLYGAILFGCDLRSANLRRAVLTEADLRRADLSEADLLEAELQGADLGSADLSEANLRQADLAVADLTDADLSKADLSGSHLLLARLYSTSVGAAKLNGAQVGGTTLSRLDLSEVQGLETVRHSSPSSIGIDTLILSKGKIPDAFLRGCGVPDNWIDYIPELIAAMGPAQFYSCFISHSSQDKAFCDRLYERMQAEHLRVWYAPRELRGGRLLREQIKRAIGAHDKLLLVLSEDSMTSAWVETELRDALALEARHGRRILFPIRLVDFERLKAWECFDSDSGRDMAVKVREYFIPDFRCWEVGDDFDAAFARLLKDLQAEAERG